MRKLFVPVIAAFIVVAFFMISGARVTPVVQRVGDADAIGVEGDEHAREAYETNMLRDPATGAVPYGIRDRELAFAATLPNENTAAARTAATSLFQPRGPWNVGGRTRALAIDVSNENNIVAGSCSGGMWRSTDGGASWKPTTPPNQYKSVSCLAQDTRPGHTNVWYFGSGEATGASASANGAYYLGDGIYKSTDSGVTWTVLPSTTDSNLTSLDIWGDIIWNIVTDPSDTVNDIVYAASYGAIYRSTNGGTTWTPVLGSFETSYYTDVAITRTGVVYATLSTYNDGGGIYRSTDGITWTNITPAGYPSSYNRIKIGISPSDENQVYFLSNNNSGGLADTDYLNTLEFNSLWRYTYLSGNGDSAGGVWQDRSRSLPHTGDVFNRYYCQGSYDMVVKVKPDDTNVVFIGGTDLYRSNSAFADSVHTVYYGGYSVGAELPAVGIYLDHHPDQHELVFYPGNPDKMLSGNDGGIFYCNDNTSSQALWTSLNNGYTVTMFYTCALDHSQASGVITGGAQDNGSWFANNPALTTPWTTPMGGDGSYCAIADNGNTYYFSSQQGKMTKAHLNYSGYVTAFNRIDPTGGKNYQFVNPFVVDPNDNNLMYLAGGKFLWRNNNLSGIALDNNWNTISTNWYQFPDSNLINNGGNYYVSAVAVSTVPANRVYFAVSSTTGYQMKLYRLDSANNATSIYHDITSPMFPNNGFGYSVNAGCIAVDPANADHIMVVFTNYNVYSLFYSPDGGTTWSKVAGNLEQNKTTGTGDGPSLRWATIMPVSDGTVYMVGTSIGLFATTELNDTNTVWVQQAPNTIGADVVNMIDYRPFDGMVAVATHSLGIYSGFITSTGDITGIKNLAVSGNGINFINYPNPFNAQTNIQFDLQEGCHVDIRVTDQSGRLVQTVADGTMGAGTHQFTFNSGNLSSGIYYCTVHAGAYTGTKQMVLVR